MKLSWGAPYLPGRMVREVSAGGADVRLLVGKSLNPSCWPWGRGDRGNCRQNLIRDYWLKLPVSSFLWPGRGVYTAWAGWTCPGQAPPSFPRYRKRRRAGAEGKKGAWMLSFLPLPPWDRFCGTALRQCPGPFPTVEKERARRVLDGYRQGCWQPWKIYPGRSRSYPVVFGKPALCKRPGCGGSYPRPTSAGR